MICSSGDKIYGEFSQDCIRCNKIMDEKEQRSLTKDVWRAGGSHPDKSLVLYRYMEMSNYIENYTRNLVMSEMKNLLS